MLYCAALASLFFAAASQDNIWQTIEVDGRQANVLVPNCVNSHSPIILSLHAWGQKKTGQAKLDNFVDHIGPECAVVVYPEGKSAAEYLEIFGHALGFSWNAGGCCPNANLDKVDDVGYLDHLSSAVAQKFGANADIVFVVGVSNGGMMANRYACEGKNVKALASVAGPLMNSTPNEKTDFVHCNKTLPVLHIHGLSDGLVPYDGCKDLKRDIMCAKMSKLPGFPPLPWPSTPHAIEEWRAHNGINSSDIGKVTFTNGNTKCTSWGGLENNVTLCTVQGLGHAWPGAKWAPTCLMPGFHCSNDIKASAEVMAFFRRYVPAQNTIVV